MQQEVRLNISDGDPFHADEISVIHNPLKFIFDFKSVTPRLDMPGQPMRVSMKHDVITADPFMAKDFLNALKKNIDDYEKKFGTIEKPRPLVKAQKLKKQRKTAKKTTKSPVQDYFG
ncbi:MAG: DUF3467 domain-containing protein [DPANN group archaeon]|nr:DUF3467 domain-containing protein [DPANN group archaeon]